MVLKFLIVIFFASVSQISLAQSVVGFWEITNVKVGDQTMTPGAKWTRINKDGTYQSGNGWQQNSEGTWKFDSQSKTFLPNETNGIKEPYGAFLVSFNGKNMMWQREEDGMLVTVSLKPIEKMPKSTADEIVGLWDLTDAIQDKQSIKEQFDPDEKFYIFIRWDKIYVKRTSEGDRETGYWFINAHQPELTFLSHNSNKKPESWKVTVSNSELILNGISDSNKRKVLRFQRINEFPE